MFFVRTKVRNVDENIEKNWSKMLRLSVCIRQVVLKHLTMDSMKEEREAGNGCKLCVVCVESSVRATSQCDTCDLHV